MSFPIATTTIVGNLTRDPELRFTPGGHAVANFGIAVGTRRKDEQGKWGDGDTSFFDVTVWRDLAENCAESLEQGMRVIVHGKLGQRSWENDDGDKRSKVELTADYVGPDLRWVTCEVHRIERTDTSYDAPPAREPVAAEEPF